MLRVKREARGCDTLLYWTPREFRLQDLSIEHGLAVTISVVDHPYDIVLADVGRVTVRDLVERLAAKYITERRFLEWLSWRE